MAELWQDWVHNPKTLMQTTCQLRCMHVSQTLNSKSTTPSDLFRVSDIVRLDAANGGKGDGANTADTNGGKCPALCWRQSQGYFIGQTGTQPCNVSTQWYASNSRRVVDNQQ